MAELFQPGYDFDLAVSAGLISNVSHFSFYGRSLELVTDTLTDVGPLGVDIIPLPDIAGESLEVVSDDPADIGMDINLTLLGPYATSLDPVVVTLNGTTAVPIPGSIARVNHGYNASSTPFAGTVSIQGAGGGTVYAVMLATHQQINQCMHTVPADQLWAIGYTVATMSKGGPQEGSVEFRFNLKHSTFNRWRMVFGFGVQRGGDSAVEWVNKYPDQIPGGVDFKITARASYDGAIASAFCSARQYKNG